jgi:hypothetical protein
MTGELALEQLIGFKVIMDTVAQNKMQIPEPQLGLTYTKTV